MQFTGGSGGGGGFIGSIFGGFRRDGGDVQRGRSFVVGEDGPEIFTPPVNGTIIPNGMSLGGRIVQITQHLHFNAALEAVEGLIRSRTPQIATETVQAVLRGDDAEEFA